MLTLGLFHCSSDLLFLSKRSLLAREEQHSICKNQIFSLMLLKQTWLYKTCSPTSATSPLPFSSPPTFSWPRVFVVRPGVLFATQIFCTWLFSGHLNVWGLFEGNYTLIKLQHLPADICGKSFNKNILFVSIWCSHQSTAPTSFLCLCAKSKSMPPRKAERLADTGQANALTFAQ